MSSKKRRLPDSILNEEEAQPHKKQRISNDDTKASQNVKMKELMEKYKAKQQENITLKQNLLNKIVGVGDDTHFPNIEEFVKEYKVFINQTHNNLLNALMDILEEILENEEDDDLDIESIELQQISYEIIHQIIIKCYKEMEKRKNGFYEIIGDLLHIANNKEFHDKISMFVDSYLQIKWDSFIKNKYYTMKLSHIQDCNHDDIKQSSDSNDETFITFEHNNIDNIIDKIYNETKVKLVKNTSTTYSVLFMLCNTRNSMDIHVFIGKCCVLFWIMVLYKQHTLKLSHDSFWIKQCPDKFTPINYSIDLKKTNNSNMIRYCGIPGVILQNKLKNNESVMVIEPHVFVHDNASVIKALSSESMY